MSLSSMSSTSSIERFLSLIRLYRKDECKLQIPENMKCLLCLKILLNSTQTNCGCRYCKECIEDYLKDGPKECKGGECGVIESTQPDQAMNRDIYKLKVPCLYEGCQFMDLIRNIGNHLETCDFQTVSCPSCEKESVKSKLLEHMQKECEMREVKCENCLETMTFGKYKKIHLQIDKAELCPKYEAPCPYQCEVKGSVNVRKHRKSCKKKPLICPYSEIGCIAIVTQENRNDHMLNDAFIHAEFIAQKIKQNTEENAMLKTNLEHTKKELENLKIELAKAKRESESKMTEMMKSVKASSPMNSLKSNDDKVPWRNGTYIWRIDQFSNLKRAAVRGDKISITSDPFFTKEFGYKMSMKIYPAGDGVGKNTHLSVFFTLMRGDYDNLLSWPFKNKVTLTILDQVNKTTDHSDTFKPDHRSSCYQQPTAEYNVASGSPKFITFEQLNDFYLKDDTIFLKIQVLN